MPDEGEVNQTRARTVRLLTIQALAGLAQWIDVFLIFSVPAFLWQSSPGQIALLASLFGIPSLILGPFVGAFLDRTDPRKAVYFGILARSTLTAVIAFAPNYWSFAILVLLKGFSNVCYWPASSIVANYLVGPTARVKFYSSLSVLDQGAKIITPLVAGMLTLLFNSQLIFLFSACATTIGAGLLPKLFSEGGFEQDKRNPSRNGDFENLGMSFRHALLLPRNLFVTVALGIGMSLALAVYDPHLAPFLSSSGFDARAFSIVVSATGAGAVIGAVLVRFVFVNATAADLMRGGIAMFTAAITGAAVVSTIYMESAGIRVFVFLWLMNGFGYELFLIGSGVNLQNLCPRPMLGRISTSARSMQMLAVVTGPSFGAWLIATQARSMPFVVAAAFAWLLLGFSIVGLRTNLVPSSDEAVF